MYIFLLGDWNTHLPLRRSENSFSQKSAYLDLTQHFLYVFDQENFFYVSPEDAPPEWFWEVLF